MNRISIQPLKRGAPDKVTKSFSSTGTGVDVAGATVSDWAGTMTVTTAAAPSDTLNWMTSEMVAGSLAARISTKPGLSMRREILATPEVVTASCCWNTPPPSPPSEMVKRTTVPSGTRLPLWSRIVPVRTVTASPILNSGMTVGSGVCEGTAVEAESAGRSRKSEMTCPGSGAVTAIKSYPMPGIETGECPPCGSSW